MARGRFLLILFLVCSFGLWGQDKTPRLSKKYPKEQAWLSLSNSFLDELVNDSNTYTPLDKTQIDTLYKQRGLRVNFTEEFAYYALRQNDIRTIEELLREKLGLKKWQRLVLTVDGLPLEDYVPNYYLQKQDKNRQGKEAKVQHVQNISTSHHPSLGLNGRHLALWNSHGKYYHHQDSCWKWQRAPLFTTVEDLFTSTYVLPFLVPMLENAGANVYLPRERDVQTHELIIDNADDGFSVEGASQSYAQGFKNHLLLNHSSLNPFSVGESMMLEKGAQATWQGRLPESGKYAVYVSYAFANKSTKEAKYTVWHAGGETSFKVNQQMGAGTWVYLGHFDFDKEAKVSLSTTKGEANADAVRFGGGMGSIPREGQTSGVPRWQEAARYYLQYSGALDTLTFNRHGDTIDYNDDFRSRARWVNYLMGDKAVEPWIKNEASIAGLHLPIDLAMGLHTDAGHFNSLDTTVGVLAIYSTYDVGKNRDFYYSKTSRLTNRDLADLVQTQIVEDVRSLYDATWTRRELWDKMYSEATFAQAPSLLLEIHGHANAQDMRYGLNPKFRFDVSRAIYKACLRFVSSYYKQDYVVAPLPVSELAIKPQGNQKMLRWTPVLDPLEATAVPESYIVYKQINGLGWDNGTKVNGTNYVLSGDTGLVTYKVTAVNDGGESFPSQNLTVFLSGNSPKSILVIDGFTRVDAPAFMESGDSVGVAPWQDEGVAYGLDIGTIGWQYNYNQNDPWLSDEKPGHGGSSFELSDRLFLGNDFNHSFAYAKVLKRLGYDVVASSAAAVEKGLVKLSDYDAVILAYGEQRRTYLPKGEKNYDMLGQEMIEKLEEYLALDGKLFINGAHLASAGVEGDAEQKRQSAEFLTDYCGIAFANKVKPEHHVVLNCTDSSSFYYNVKFCEAYYRVENADAFMANDDAEVLSKYANNDPATVGYDYQGRVVSSGFPFETIVGENKQLAVMKQYLEYLFNEE